MIVVANLLSPALDDLTIAIRDSLGARLEGEVVSIEAGVEDFRRGRVGVALVCGLAYTLLHDIAPDRFVPVAAPIVDDARVVDGPVYFSEIVVPAGHPAATLQELRAASFAYNEDVSFSGYRALEHELKAAGLSWDFFRQRIRTGSHRRSLAMVADGEADATAIDSHALLLEKRLDPSLAERTKVIASLGPYPAPPVAIDRTTCDLPEDRLREVLHQLSADGLAKAAIRSWQAVDDSYYDPVRAVTAGMRLEL